MYNRIVRDEEFQAMMTQIGSFHFTDAGKWDWEHGMGHALKVSRYVQQILESLHEKKKIVELGMIAGLLHDIGLVDGIKKHHAEKSAIYARKYLQKFPIKKKDVDIIVDAIENHSNGEHIRSTVSAALLLADKIDISKHRVENSTIWDTTNQEFAKMNRVDIEIDTKYMYIFYKTEKDFDPSVFGNWIKALTVPYRVSHYLKRECIFKMNHQDFDVESMVNQSLCKQISW